MKADDAEALLPLYRAGRRAEGRVQKAVRYAEAHDTLRKTLSEQMEFDDQIVDVIHFIKPPENLRHKLREMSTHPQVRRKRSQVFNPAVLTAVCGILLIIGFCVWTVMERMEKFPGRESVERMLTATSRMTGMELEPVTSSTGALGDWFYMRGFEGYVLPAEIGALPAVGSGVLRIDGHPIAQLAVDRQNSILYVFHAADFDVEIPAGEAWKTFDHEGWAAAVSRRGNLCYVLARRGTKEEMEAFLETLKK